MAMAFYAVLKDMARECPLGVLAAFDKPQRGPVKSLNVDLCTISKRGDLVPANENDAPQYRFRLGNVVKCILATSFSASRGTSCGIRAGDGHRCAAGP